MFIMVPLVTTVYAKCDQAEACLFLKYPTTKYTTASNFLFYLANIVTCLHFTP